ncbi:Pentatricopeptide repeat [Macleaya cordata]|uniref:Pentatricopeptide repeat n=1 Tax=Macleaya cordata TaxID=56857 RepID=A0A200PPH7_MACCD|nr:Pentatricopeptide repeat [Macleaya cordata]
MRLIYLKPLHRPAISIIKLNSLNCSSVAASKKYFNTKTSVSSILESKYYDRLLEDCTLSKNLVLGKLIHSRIVINGLEKDSFFVTKLICLYSVCGNVSKAESIFDRLSVHNVYTLNAMIRGYSTNGLYQQAVNLFYEKKKGGIKPDSYTFSCLLKVCALSSDLQQGEKIAKLAEEYGFESDLFVSNSLIAMFGKCGRLIDAVRVFEKLGQRDIVSWNSIISAYIENGNDWEAMDKFCKLVRSELRPDQVSIISALSICSSATTVRELHGYSLKSGYESNPTVRNSLISMYGKFGRTEEAHFVFNYAVKPDKITWNALISSYAQNGYFEKSRELLQDMKDSGFDSDVVTYSGIISSLAQNDQSNEAMNLFIEMVDLGLKPDVITIASTLPAVSDLLYFDYCKEIHGYSYRNKFESDRRVQNALISVYSKCGSIQNAVQVFADVRNRDVISWSSMIVGYVQNGFFNEAQSTFREMIIDKTEPNPITVTSILSACSGIACFRRGKEIHLWALKNGFEAQTFVGSALIDMYAKCGRIEYSKRVFDMITDKNLVTWNSMIGGYAVHGLGKEALDAFQRVEKPDHVSFIAVLSACNHGGLVDEGIKIFNSMKDFGLNPRESHYTCIVDLLGRSGWLNEALNLIRTMPVEANADIWGALLSACKIHSNLEIGSYTGSQIIESGSENPGYYVLLSNIWADFGRWGEVEVMRKKMKERGVRKVAGCSWIEVNKEVYSFVAKDRTEHPEWKSLFKMLRSLNEHMKEMS